MCGIAGAVSGTAADPGLVESMLGLLAHRGPDAAGSWAGAGTAIGMRRLAIVDVAGGAQPVFSEDRSVVAVLNGEIYNHAELRELLRSRGHRLASQADTECLVHLYEEFGDDLVDHLRGMFAFAIWDAGRRRLVLARDRVGKKPLFYRPTPDGLQFASELKAFLADPEFPRVVDPAAVHGYLACAYVPGQGSIWRDVRRVPPAGLLVWHDGVVSLRRYWQMDHTEREDVPFEQAAEELRAHLLEATRIRLIGERPIGVLLSGGVDSSAVLAAMARQVSGRISTFTIGFEDAASDERRYARMAAEQYGTDHHEWVLSSDVTALLPGLTWHFDEPFADSSAIPTFFVAQMSSAHVTVVLNGDGGDECFGGYDRYALMAAGDRISLPPLLGGPVSRFGARLAGSASGRRARRAGRMLELAGHRPVDRYAELMCTFPTGSDAGLYTPAFAEQVGGTDGLGHIRSAWQASGAGSLTNRMLDVDTQTYLAGDLLPKMDLATMAHGLEARSPLLDHHLMSWAAALPGDYKVAGKLTKRILKHAVRDWVPAEVLHRRKAGFGVPMDDWLRAGLRPLARDVLTDATARNRGIFRPEAVLRLLEEHDAGRGHGRKIWSLVQLELWHRRFVDSEAADMVRSAPGEGTARC